MKNRFVLESFEEFLNYQKEIQLNEARGPEEVTLDKEGIKAFFEKLIEYNYLLSQGLTKDMKGGTLKETRMAQAAYANPKSPDYAPAKVALVEALHSLKTYSGKDLTEMANSLGLPWGKGENPTRPGSPYTSVQKKRIIDDFMREDLKEMSEEDARKKFDDFITKYGGTMGNKILPKSGGGKGFKNIAVWGLVEDTEKDKIYDEMLQLALKKGYTSEEQLMKIAEKAYKDRKRSDISSMYNPGFQGYLKTEKVDEITKTVPVGEPKVTMMLEKEESAGLFKPNMFGANGEADYMDNTFKKLLQNLSTMFARSMAGEIKITKINVYTSADRYRNTKEAEKLTWGELSYARAVSMSKLIGSTAEAVGLPPEIATQMNSMVSLYYRGTNEDGTSGPNPPEGIKFGYYVKDGDKSKWVDGENRNEVVVIEIGDQGQPLADNADSAKKSNMSPEANKDKYNQYRYNLIEVEYEEYTVDPNLEKVTEDVFGSNYPIKVSIPSRFTTKQIRIPIPTISIGSKSVGKGSKPGECPSFEETTALSIGFGIKKVNIAKWQKDLAR